MSTEYGWLLEGDGKHPWSPRGRYLSMDLGLVTVTIDNIQATRFVRKEDAEAIRQLLINVSKASGEQYPFVEAFEPIEHGWG